MIKPNNPTLNLLEGHSDFVVDSGIGPVIYFHGKPVDLTKVSRAKAEQMANDKSARYVRYSPAYLAAQAKAAGAH